MCILYYFYRLYGEGKCMYLHNSAGLKVLNVAANTWNIDVKKRVDEACEQYEKMAGVDITCSRINNKNKKSQSSH